MLHFPLQLLLVLQHVVQLVVLLNRLFLTNHPQQGILLLHDLLHTFCPEVLVELSFEEVPSDLFGVLLELVLVLLYLPHQGQKRVVVLFFI